MSERQVSFVPIPCDIIDEIMPALRDTELRVLLVVLRQTWGWRDEKGKTKQRDWLSHRQIKERTGRASEAVSAAIDALVRRGLVSVHNEQGKELATPAERRRVKGRLYYQPGPLLRQPALRTLKTEDAKSKTTTEELHSFSGTFRKADQRITEGSSEPSATPAIPSGRSEVAKRAIRKRLAHIIQSNEPG